MNPPPGVNPARLRAAYEKVKGELLAERTPEGYWVGELSSSALSTATAVSALAVARRRIGVPPVPESDDLISRGVNWLTNQQNADGGFGDTDLSHSNIATTYLVIAALHLAGVADQHAALIERANRYIDSKGRLDGLRQRYGIDKTFVVPIMTNLALAGLVEWREIDPLPFELACVPQSWYRFVGMPVVSYAIPALVAIGQARFFHAPPSNPLIRLIRRLAVKRSLKVLRQMQPASGGYLEATPLTSFVVMSLASIPTRSVSEGPALARSASEGSGFRVQGSGFRVQGSGFRVQGSTGSVADEILREGVKFLINSARRDGSWPIDTNLATWNTTLAINALAAAGEDVAALLGPDCLNWLLACQHTQRHPFTGANPGGFGWSDLSGAVPDADDTPGALLALNAVFEILESADINRRNIDRAADQGLGWLCELRNRNGGWPTFCRGWGKLPFDRSGTDLTAHALRAFAAWQNWFDDHEDDDFGEAPAKHKKLRRAGLKYLRRTQRPDGSWAPLWFGNQDHPAEENPVYGTAKVLFAYRDLGLLDSPEAQRGLAWFIANQNEDCGWGSGCWQWSQRHATGELRYEVLRTQYSVPSTASRHLLPSARNSTSTPSPNSQFAIPNLQSSIEETSLALEALLAFLPPNPAPPPPTPDPLTLNPESRTLNPSAPAAVSQGLSWLIDRVEQNQHRQPAPIGFYFAKLWYYEKLYPLTFTVAALGRACRQFASLAPPDSQP